MNLAMDYHLEDFQELGNTEPIKQCFKYALGQNDRERFGIFKFNNNQYNYLFKTLNNLNTVNNDIFAINNAEFYKDFLKGDVISLFHTHTTDSAELSDIDIEVSESLGLPSYVIAPLVKKHFLYYPKSYRPKDLYGRIFIPFFQDCVSFVKDFYFINFNINFYSIKNWARESDKSNIKLINEIEKQFKEIKYENINYGDLIIFKPSLSRFMHLAVYNKNNKYSHHPISGVPVDELFTEESRNKVYKIYRYKDL